MTALEDRLRSELRAESEEIAPGSIEDLRLPEQAGHQPGRLRHRGARQWPAWAKPLAAAAAVTIVVASTFVIARMLPGHPPPRITPGNRLTPPAYYAYTAEGYIYHRVSRRGDVGQTVSGRSIKVRATTTGKLLATISPPKSCNDFTLITADASADTFVFGAEHNPVTITNSPTLVQRDRREPMKFLVLHITPEGHTLLSALSLPEPLSPVRQPSIALSPDGTRLAVAFGGGPEPAHLQVITLATGQTRQWTMPHAPWAPSLGGMGAWTANGRTLMFEQVPVIRTRPRTRPIGPGRRIRPATTTRVRLLDTAAPGTSLASGKPLVLRAPPGEYPSGQPMMTPDGTTLIAPAATLVSWPVHARGGLAEYSANTGGLLRTLVPWAWRTNIHQGGRGGYPSQRAAWTSWSGSQLIVLQPRDELNVLGVVTGTVFRPGGGVLLPQRPPGYQWLQDALRTAEELAW